MKHRRLQDAKEHLGDYVAGVSDEGPYAITIHGKERAAFVPMAAYGRLPLPKSESLLQFFRRSPMRGVELHLERDKSAMRTMETGSPATTPIRIRCR